MSDVACNYIFLTVTFSFYFVFPPLFLEPILSCSQPAGVPTMSSSQEAARAEYEKLRAGKVRVNPATEEDSDSDEDYADARDSQSEQQNVTQESKPQSSSDAEPELDDTLSAEDAVAHKVRGNGLYKEGNFIEAAKAYALAASSAHATASDRAIYLANLAAAQLANGEHALVEKSATACLKLDPGYRKARERRLRARESLQNYRGALEDAHELGLPRTRLHTLEMQAQAKEKADTEKAIHELKGLADSFLSNFGMSVDDFAAKKDPETGSYSISMNR